jgi:hypothetical protein
MTPTDNAGSSSRCSMTSTPLTHGGGRRERLQRRITSGLFPACSPKADAESPESRESLPPQRGLSIAGVAGQTPLQVPSSAKCRAHTLTQKSGPKAVSPLYSHLYEGVHSEIAEGLDQVWTAAVGRSTLDHAGS